MGFVYWCKKLLIHLLLGSLDNQMPPKEDKDPKSNSTVQLNFEELFRWQNNCIRTRRMTQPIMITNRFLSLSHDKSSLCLEIQANKTKRNKTQLYRKSPPKFRTAIITTIMSFFLFVGV